MIERKIGETFRHGDVILRVVEDPEDTCERCYFRDHIKLGLCRADGSACIGSNREDHTSVRYVFDGWATVTNE